MTAITPAQIRGARGFLDWSLMDLAKAAGVSVSTVKRIGDCKTEFVSQTAMGQIRRALEGAGVEFLDDEGRGPGMRLMPRQAQSLSRFMR